jgi:hypothetical protein
MLRGNEAVGSKVNGEKRCACQCELSLFFRLSGFLRVYVFPHMEVGRVVICDTPQHAERFATLRSGGKNTEVALRTVNDEIKYLHPCCLPAVSRLLRCP